MALGGLKTGFPQEQPTRIGQGVLLCHSGVSNVATLVEFIQHDDFEGAVQFQVSMQPIFLSIIIRRT